MKHKRVYEMLKRAGHSPWKALEIIIEARRKDKWALDYIRSWRARRT